jgi:N utilization substance protein B
MDMKRQTRSEARCAAFTQIFQMNQHEDDMDNIMDELLQAIPECENNLGYINMIINGVKKHEKELEEIISEHIKDGWSYSRMSKAAQNILKLAIFEMKYVDDIPAKVSINEAVELAKKYGDENDPTYINGILASVYKSL